VTRFTAEGIAAPRDGLPRPSSARCYRPLRSQGLTFGFMMTEWDLLTGSSTYGKHEPFDPLFLPLKIVLYIVSPNELDSYYFFRLVGRSRNIEGLPPQLGWSICLGPRSTMIYGT
jgi:hypothetical protein